MVPRGNKVSQSLVAARFDAFPSADRAQLRTRLRDTRRSERRARILTDSEVTASRDIGSMAVHTVVSTRSPRQGA